MTTRRTQLQPVYAEILRVLDDDGRIPVALLDYVANILDERDSVLEQADIAWGGIDIGAAPAHPLSSLFDQLDNERAQLTDGETP